MAATVIIVTFINRDAFGFAGAILWNQPHRIP